MNPSSPKHFTEWPILRTIAFLLPILAFFGYPTLTSLFSGLDQPSAQYKEGDSPLSSDTLKKDGTTKNKTDPENNYRPKSLKLVPESAEVDNPIEVTNHIISSGRSFDSKYGNEIAIQISEAAPQIGYGKIALRVTCEYCEFMSGLIPTSILSTDTAYSHFNGWLAQKYDSNNKRATTLVKELLPDKYLLRLNFQEFGGLKYFPIEVREGQINLYHYRVANAFGKGNGQVVFVANRQIRITISIDDFEKMEVNLIEGKEVSFILPTGNHKIEIRKIAISEMDLPVDVKNLMILEGASYVFRID